MRTVSELHTAALAIVNAPPARRRSLSIDVSAGELSAVMRASDGLIGKRPLKDLAREIHRRYVAVTKQPPNQRLHIKAEHLLSLTSLVVAATPTPPTPPESCDIPEPEVFDQPSPENLHADDLKPKKKFRKSEL